jgi:peptidoglycan hydrolase-like protein with peptidoglycan-binding domain
MMRAAAASLLLVLLLAPNAFAAGDPEIAALQVGLRNRGFYAGSVDGVLGGGTVVAVKRLQRRAGLPIDGVPGVKTRVALGRYGRRAPLGRRVLLGGMHGWDVAALQFALAWHGFPSGSFDGVFGNSTESALRKFQRWAGIHPDGRASASTIAALRKPLPVCPIGLAAPARGRHTDGFGPRGHRFHTGIDYPGATGTPVAAAAAGRVTFAGRSLGGLGYLVTIAHPLGTTTMYSHLSRIGVRAGQRIHAGQRIGRIGATGRATGPHLHFEVRLRGAAVDPLTGLAQAGGGGLSST